VGISALAQDAAKAKDIFRVAHAEGPIKTFQGDPHHRDLLQVGLCFGMEKLTSEELADCFEQTAHAEKPTMRMR